MFIYFKKYVSWFLFIIKQKVEFKNKVIFNPIKQLSTPKNSYLSTLQKKLMYPSNCTSKHSSQINRQFSRISLSKLNQQKGKFSLTNRYNNNLNNYSSTSTLIKPHPNPLNNSGQITDNNSRQITNDNSCQIKKYFSQRDKENAGLRANLSKENEQNLKQNQRDDCLKRNTIGNYDHSRKNIKNNEKKANMPKITQKNDTDHLYNGPKRQEQHFYRTTNFQISVQGNTQQLKNRKKQPGTKATTAQAKKDNTTDKQINMPVTKKRHQKSFTQKLPQSISPPTQLLNPRVTQNKPAINVNAGKNHKYLSDQNQFLQMKQNPLHNKERTMLDINKLLTEEMNSNQQKCKQLDKYKKTTKQVIFSMMRMISIVSRWGEARQNINKNKSRTKDNQSDNNNYDNDNTFFIQMIRKQVLSTFSKQLMPYIDELGIKEQLIIKAIQQNLMQSTSKQQEQHCYQDNRSQNNEIAQSRSMSSQTFNEHMQEDSILQEFQIRQEKSFVCNQMTQKSALDKNSINRSYQTFSNSNFFNLSYHDQLLEILPSRRNLLDTFNNQNLAEGLEEVKASPAQNYYDKKASPTQNGCDQESQTYQNDQERNKYINNKITTQNQDNARGQKQQLIRCKDISIRESQKIQNQMRQMMKMITSDEQSVYNNGNNNQLFQDINSDLEAQNKQHRLYRKLFKQSYEQQQKYNDQLSKSQQQIPKPQQQPLMPQSCYLMPQHYYLITNQLTNQSNNNCLQTKKNDVIKLLRKINQFRWIAQSDDRIGFVEIRNIGKQIIGRL